MGAIPLDNGYFAILGVNFRSSSDDVARKYKKLAMRLHPDKNKDPDAVDRFQQLTTSCEPRTPAATRDFPTDRDAPLRA